MKFIKTVLTGLVVLICISSFAQKKTEKYKKLEIEMFPKAKAGYKQTYFQVPIEENEEDLKIQLYVGYDAMVDCNHKWLDGNIETKTLKEWWFPYYEVESDGLVGTTAKGCGGQKETKKFIYLPSKIIEYDSRIPFVLYIPENMEVRYRILRPDPAPLKKAIQK